MMHEGNGRSFRLRAMQANLVVTRDSGVNADN